MLKSSAKALITVIVSSVMSPLYDALKVIKPELYVLVTSLKF